MIISKKKQIPIKPKQGFLAAAVQEFYSELADVKHADNNLSKALKFVDEEPSKKIFRESGGGWKCKTPEVREAMFEWFINVREVLKGRLLIKMFQSKSQQVYNELLKQQTEPVPEQDQLKFSKHWIQDWMKEYNVSLRKPNKKYLIKKED